MKTPPRRLLLPLALAAGSLVLWDTFVVYPFRLFVVFLHEISHGLAAVATGGRIVSIGLSFDGTVVPLVAGYAGLGSAALVAVLVTERGRLFGYG